MTRTTTILVLLLAAMLSSHGASAQLGRTNDTLKTGDTAPPLSIDRWINGTEQSISAGKIHLVIFWSATDISSVIYGSLWSAVQRILDEEVTVIGITRDESARVRQFQRLMEFAGTKVEYNIAIDRDGQTWRDWMEKAQKTRMPTVFVTDKEQKIQYIGHPADPNFFEALTLALAGRYNEKLFQEAAPLLQAAERERKLNNWRMFHKYMDEVIEKDPRVFNVVALRKFEIMLFEENDTKKSIEYLSGPFKEKYLSDAETLAQAVNMLLLDARMREKEAAFVPLALDLAKACYEAAGPNSYEGMAVLALAHYHNGNYDEAVNLQSRAYYMADPFFKDRFRTALQEYREAARK